MSGLDGKVAVVTGASRGIGEYIARRFGQEGAKVAVSARTEQQTDERLPGTIHDTANAVREAGGQGLAVAADLSKPEDRERLIETTERELGPVDILVNNAAVTFFLPTEEFPERRWRLMFEVQVRAPFELAQIVLPGMRERGGGSILNISSGAARHPQPGSGRAGGGGTVYGMCKAAIERFSSGLAAEVYEHSISVNALSPSRVVPTPGVQLHRLIRPGMEDQAEPPEVMAEAALAICTANPKELTGRITYSQQILEELGWAIPSEGARERT